MNSPYSSSSRPNPQTRPAMIAELAEAALENLWDEKLELKHYLRTAERCRSHAKHFINEDDYENAFIEYARAATLVLEKLSSHRDYHTLLNAAQRHNLALNGQDILDKLGELKPMLVDRYEKWSKQHPDPTNPNILPDFRRRRLRSEELFAQEEQRRRRSRHDRPRTRERDRDKDKVGLEREREKQSAVEEQLAEELRLYKEQREAVQRQQAADDRERERDRAASRAAVAAADRKREVAVAAARSAATQPPGAVPDLTFSRTPVQNNAYNGTPLPQDSRRPDEEHFRHQQQQEEMRHREEEIVRKREQKKWEQEGFARRQQESDEAARAVRQTIASNNMGVATAMTPSSLASTPSVTYSTSASSSNVSTPATSFYENMTPTQSTSGLRPPPAVKSRPPSFLSAQFEHVPPIMPLESPTRYEDDSTDSESVHNGRRSSGKQKQAMDYSNRTPSRAPARSPSYPPPITTTSPPPADTRIQYPQLMSQHQKHQGYYPSLNSMFGPATADSFRYATAAPGSNFKDMYPSYLLPRPSAPYGTPQPSPTPQAHPIQYPSYPGPSRPAPPVPSTTPPSSARASIDRTMGVPKSEPSPALRTVTLPRGCLPRFLTLAKANTDMNMETCGLLLGRDRGGKFLVTTLLIPKQHSTSDTCTMDEEELVMQFTEERDLITLGWIHTHPSQSCFMSSVDLHTHSGFQCMLPESFAVVCAPKSNPNFGIFRLTDPPGLKTVLECTAKEAFHPHPDLPIYTDADKGHVQMKEIPLEIVDLRNR
ncbi:AMSH-like protease sst2 [Hypsizygus marmoreus]|uniref:AMSH-like protease sst2 n=1 Tax=Hypsizygus marmoreus TaxID=39966 RepID=A0A369J5T8_HYPMA|nr:AMSH-like protease sst2 [Hypsizygus marmoreus]